MTPALDPRQWRLCIAPMMQKTDRHFRHLARLLAPHARLYTEMLTARAILRRGELTAVYVAAANGFLLRAVRTGPTGGDMVDVVTGLRAGERVALDPVRAGMPGAIAE